MSACHHLYNDVKVFFHALWAWGPREAFTDLGHYVEARWYERSDRFDERYRVETSQMVGVYDLKGRGLHADDASHYWPTREQDFERMMESLGSLELRNYVFVDVGCGKGRVALMAGRFPFRRVVGFDFSEQLIDTARENLVRFTGPISTPIDLVVENALEYQFPQDDLILYLFDPFGLKVLHRFIENLQASQREHPREIWVIYYAPEYWQTFVDAGFERVSQQMGECWGWHVYRLPNSAPTRTGPA